MSIVALKKTLDVHGVIVLSREGEMKVVISCIFELLFSHCKTISLACS